MATALSAGIARPLTPRQAEFLALVDEGLTHQQIAERFDVSVRTVTSVVYGVLNRVRRSEEDSGGLTRRQLECLVLVAQGMTDQQIAGVLFISARTVQNTLAQARERLDAKTTPHCLILAIAREWLILDHQGQVLIPIAQSDSIAA